MHIEAVVWVVTGNNDLRLFAAGLQGVIVEYDLISLLPKSETSSMGGPIWSMQVDPFFKRIAIGCEDGKPRIFKVEDNAPLEFSSILEKQKGRVISLAWHPVSNHVVVGSIDGRISIIDVQTGHSIQRMKVDSVRGEKTVVWDIKIIPDSTIISADSLGHVSFWNWDSGSRLKSFKAHLADAICLAVSKTGNKVYSSGVDCRLTLISRKSTADSNWVLIGKQKYHSHDVRCLELIEERPYDVLCSGGVDTSLIFSGPTNNFKTMSHQRMPTFPQRTPVSLSTERRLLMSHSNDCIELWHLGLVSLDEPSFDSGVKRIIDDKDKLIHHDRKQILRLNYKVTLADNFRGSIISLVPRFQMTVHGFALQMELK